MEKPEGLIPKEKMVLILEDLAIINAAKNTNMALMRKHGVEPTTYVLDKHGVDSLHFAQSDNYYASLPSEYESIYKQVEAKLGKRSDSVRAAKQEKDSLDAIRLDKDRKVP